MLTSIPMQYGAGAAWNTVLYGETHPSTRDFLRNQLDEARRHIVSAGSSFLDRAIGAFDHYNSSAALQFARKVVSNVQGAFDVARIMEYDRLEQFQHANSIMQRWIMANPMIRERYHAQRCDGYSDTWQDIDPGRVAEQHYDWRRVNDGIIQFQDDSEAWTAPQYLDELRDGDRDLILSEQTAILRSWRVAEALMALGRDDLTSPTGDQL